MSNFFETGKDNLLQQGIIGCTVAAMYSDGEASQEDIDIMISLLMGRSIFQGHNAVELMKESIGLYNALDDKNVFLILSTGRITEEWKDAVFAIACYILFKDKMITNEERLFLKTLKEKINLSDESSNKIIEVMQALFQGLI